MPCSMIHRKWHTLQHGTIQSAYPTVSYNTSKWEEGRASGNKGGPDGGREGEWQEGRASGRKGG